jgi:hypothetical protein
MKRSITYIIVAAITVCTAAGGLERREVQRQRQEVERSQVAAGKARQQLSTEQGAAKRDRAQAQEAAKAANDRLHDAMPDSGDPDFDKRLRTLIRKMYALRHWMENTAGEMLPELQFVDDSEWLSQAHGINDLANVPELQRASRALKRQGQFGLLAILRSALRSYVRDSGGQLPANLVDLRPYCVCPIDDVIWARYEMAAAGELAKLRPAQPVFGERMSDEDLKHAETIRTEDVTVRIAAPHAELFAEQDARHRQATAIFAAVRAFRKAHPAENPTSAEQLRPYMSEPALLEGVTLANGGDAFRYDHGAASGRPRP